ncbi:hypothetical protein HYC85_012863 [Camellia sinensis]|uniref:EF-hand domain-containing protein n=1 Tax=Camellia sinensis TaxID=4442 RepID=A0A7J7HD68_CAMSI|nr:hypothetical protein HYC85_012863 [Camellia sinensis]
MCPTGTTAPTLRPDTTASGTAEFRSAFDVLDVDNDGKISRDDLRNFYSGFSAGGGEAAAEEVVGTMMSVADSNKDGYVEYDEFEKVLDSRRNGSRGGERLGVMEEAFRVMDRDGDGRVGEEDLRSYLRWAGFEASDEDIKAMIRLGGGGGENHGVTFDGFLQILAV